ncbi:fungal-specific transcription factor domain protein [Aspergillus sclerotioniger CBS 115572]|uniref:Fungal-specific transcription factor domain protein n=1 Tax=Aspergillus sclerotioniger CBS 115572 TaxID=1450535 RepID=A0A317VFR1_9EURO|nr:fungal-specific transcription factor domain protein [Aspergillus sclerotioniger CBS 115572]PWY73223.1 fungal-specific transcription factor domain protein [Aspergillus sclerotioniger CBS 115572]
MSMHVPLWASRDPLTPHRGRRARALPPAAGMQVVVPPLSPSTIRSRPRDHLLGAFVAQPQPKRRRLEVPSSQNCRDREATVDVYSVSSDQSDHPATHPTGTGINAHIERLNRLQHAVDARTGRLKEEPDDDMFLLQVPGVPNGRPQSRSRSSSIAESLAQLPSDLMDSLIATYLAREYVNWPIFDLSEFQAACEKVGDMQDLSTGSSGFHAILMMIICLSGLRHHRMDGAYLQSLFDHAQRMTGSPDWQGTPWMRVQCLFLQCQYLNATGNPRQAWALIGYTIRLMQGLGLQSKTSGRDGRERQQRELGRRLWHSAVILERMLSLQIGLPPQVANPLQVLLPTHLDTDYIDSVSGATPSYGGERPSIIEFLLACSRLYSHVHDIAAWEADARVRHGSCAAKKLLALDLAPFLKTDALLYDWQNSLPLFLRIDNPAALADDPIVRRQRDLLRARYLYIRLRLYRPILILGVALSARCICRPDGHPHMTETEPSSVETPMVNSVVRDASIKCAVIALELVELIWKNTDNLLDGGPDDTQLMSGSPYWENVDFLYASGTVILAARLCPFLKGNAVASRARLKDCRTRLLRLFNPYNGFRGHGHLGDLMQLCRSTLKNISGALKRNASGDASAGLDEEMRSRLVDRTMNTPARGRKRRQSTTLEMTERAYFGWIESLPIDLVDEVA